MIKIVSEKELERIENQTVRAYVTKLFNQIWAEYKDYCTDGTISSLGAFFVLESADELKDYKSMGLAEPITAATYEWIDEFCPEYFNMAVVIDTDRAVNIIAERTIFKEFLEVENEND